MIASTLEFASLGQRAFGDEVLQITCGRGSRSARDRDVVFRTQPALEACRAFAHQPCNGLLLAFVERIAQAVVEPCFGDDEIYQSLRLSLGGKDRGGEVNQPVGDLIAPAAALQLVVVGLAATMDDQRQGCERGPTEPFGERFLGNGATDAAIASLERMNADEIQVGDACTSQGRQWRFACGGRACEPLDKPKHLVGH